MKRDELEQKNLSVFLQKEGEIKPRRVRFPEVVDVSAGTVSFWIPKIPVVGVVEVEENTDLVKVEPPEEIEFEATLTAEKGKVTLVSQTGTIWSQTSV